jgi:c-di-GMP-binding flagellar brake protein YcgR
LAADAPLRLHNVSRGGMLIEAVWPLAVDSLHTVRLESEAHVATVEARVRHVRSEGTDSRYLIGLEFVGLDAPLSEQLDRIVLRHQAAASGQ